MSRKSKRPNSKRSLRIRRATLGDLKMLVHHRRGMWEDMGVDDRTSLDQADMTFQKWVRAEMRRGNVVGWVAETSDREIVGGGCLWLRPTQPRPNLTKPIEPYLFSMFTEPRFRRKGVASRILKEAIQWSRRNNHRRILLHASKKGRAIYRKYGFTRTWEMRLELKRH